MKYGIIAHINSDLTALKAALRMLELHGVQSVVCAGNVLGHSLQSDAIGNPVNANECADFVRGRDFPSVIGQFDAVVCGREEPWGFESVALSHVMMHREELSDKNRVWLQGLPVGLVYKDFAVVHGNAAASRVHKNTWDYLKEHWPYPERERGKVCFIAHPDKPGVYSERGELPLDDDGMLKFGDDGNVFIAPGRLARAGKDDRWSAFGIYDTADRVYQQIYLDLSAS